MLRDIPGLFADAIHPPVPDDTPRVLSYLQKEAVDPELAASWCGHGNNFPLSLSEEDLQALNRGVWAQLPPLALLPEQDDGPRRLAKPPTEPEWEPYRLAVEAGPPGKWRLIAVWHNTAYHQWLMNYEARKQWKQRLAQQAVRGEVSPRVATSLIPTPGMVGRRLQDSFFTVEEFAAYAAPLSVDVRVRRAFKRTPVVSNVLEAMRAVPPDEKVLVTEAIGSFSGTGLFAARDWVAQLQSIDERQTQGFFTVGEAAQMLGDAHPNIDVKDMIARLGDARIGNPARRLVRGQHLLPLLDGADFREFIDLVKASDVDAWLANLDAPYSLVALCPPTEGTASSLLVQIAGRSALPVRAIPYVSGWCLSPDEVANQLARGTGKPFARLQNTSAYFLNGGRPQKMLPKEWDRYVAALHGFEGDLKDKVKNDNVGYSVWVSKAASLLPAGVFVWRDEFEKDYASDFPADALSTTRERDGERELTYAPMLEDDLRGMVVSGFQMGPEPATAHATLLVQPSTPAEIPATSTPKVHRLATRRDELAPLIEELLRLAHKPIDPAALWNEFVHLADSPTPSAPLISYRDGEVLYRGSDGAAGINRTNFIKRLKRRVDKQD